MADNALAGRKETTILGAALAALSMAAASAEAADWTDARLSPDARAQAALRVMTLDEKIALLHGHTPLDMREIPPGVVWSSGYVDGVPRLGIPRLEETDAGLGVTDPLGKRADEGATVLPSGLAQAATWNAELVREGGAVIGAEARAKSFAVVLAGGLDLVREPRGGRNFEYAGEDPLLAGTIVGSEVDGIQSQNVISTLKHFALNDQETGRFVLDAEIDDSAARESDLLAFEIAIEKGSPGSVMCAYNRVGGVYACENAELLNAILKRDWHYNGFVMSDWGATHSTEAAALNGLDQEDGEEFDGGSYFAAPLKAAVEERRVSQKRLDDMALRVLRAIFAKGVFDHPPQPAPIDFDKDAIVSQHIAEEAVVVLKNSGRRLPLGTDVARLAVIGGHADLGTLGGGGGSSEVIPHPAARLRIRHPEADFEVYESYLGSAPFNTIAERVPKADVQFAAGDDIAKAVEFARNADVAIVFATQWTSESIDVPDLSLPNGQDALIEAVAAANPHTIVVLETGGPVLMPWLDRVEAVIEAWYPGSRGAEALARILFGEIDPSGRLPVSFPMSETQLPHPALPGYESMLAARQATGNPHAPPPPFSVDYFEGANVGYRWNEIRGFTPLFPFGFGLSYTTFSYSNLKIGGGRTLDVSFDVTNTDTRAGFDTPEVYAAPRLAGRNGIRHLVGWAKVELGPGETRRVNVTADPRLIAHFDSTHRLWRIEGGPYKVDVGRFAGDAELTGETLVPSWTMAP